MKTLYILGTSIQLQNYTLDSANSGDESYLGLDKTDMLVATCDGKTYKAAASAFLEVSDEG